MLKQNRTIDKIKCGRRECVRFPLARVVARSHPLPGGQIMKGKTELVPCEICGRPIVRSEHGGYSYCENCGWRRGGDNEGLERQWGISYPMLVSLSHARAQYRQGLSFKADLDEFVNGALFYGEMLFDFGGETYEVYLYCHIFLWTLFIKYCYTTKFNFSFQKGFDGYCDYFLADCFICE